MNNEETVVILPQTAGKTLCVELRGVIERRDHQKHIRQNLNDIVSKHGAFNFLIYYGPDYKGWKQDAADSSMESIVDFGKYAEKLAYVNPPEQKVFIHKLAKPLFGGETRFFDEEELDEALEWVIVR